MRRKALFEEAEMVIADDDFIRLPAGAAGRFCATCPPKCVGEPPRFFAMQLTGDAGIDRQAAKGRGQESRATAMVRCMRTEVRSFPLFLEDMRLLNCFCPVSL